MVKVDLPHLATRIFNRPHLVSPANLDTLLASVAPRILGGGKLLVRAMDDDYDEDKTPVEAYRVKNRIAIVPVIGTLVRRSSWLDALCGFTSYDGLRASVTEAMREPDVLAVMLDIDSGGGEAGGCFDLVEQLKELSRHYSKPIWAHANETAASAAYAIACAAECIWITRTGEAGSIGVVCAHIDQSKADEKAGIKWTYIFEGEHKTHGNPHEPLADEALRKAQENCTLLYDMFIDLVMNSRAMTASEIRATKAETFIGQQAVNIGLADRVGTFEQAMQSFARQVDKKPPKIVNSLQKGRKTWQGAATGLKTATRTSKTTCRMKRQKTMPPTNTRKTKTTGQTPRTMTLTSMQKMKTRMNAPKTAMRTAARKTKKNREAARQEPERSS